MVNINLKYVCEKGRILLLPFIGNGISYELSGEMSISPGHPATGYYAGREYLAWKQTKTAAKRKQAGKNDVS